jgi:hypothetical protein
MLASIIISSVTILSISILLSFKYICKNHLKYDNMDNLYLVFKFKNGFRVFLIEERGRIFI